jgi:UDP:flavonoid glycosyltransferase YjiC (YdhE family)
VVVREFVDSREVLSRASVHVTHGGCSSVHESLLAGVPMVCIPQAGDQFAWSERITSLGAGQSAEATPTVVRTVVRTLLEDDRPAARSRELGCSLARYDGDGRVTAVVNDRLAPGVL